MDALAIDLPYIHSGVLPKNVEEVEACRVVGSLVRRSNGQDGKSLDAIAKVLWDLHAKTLWGTLGLYWYYLRTDKHTNAVLCEHILRKRFMEMDADQGHFYRQCVPWLLKAQGQLELPFPGEEEIAPVPFQSDRAERGFSLRVRPKTEPLRTTPEAVHVCKTEAFKRLMDSEHDSDNRKRLEAMLPITQPKTLGKVSAETISGVQRLLEEQPNMAEALEIILGELRARHLSQAPAKLPPLLLCGGPGTGKTRLVTEIARMMGLPHMEIPLAGSADAIKITGLSRYWATAGSGFIARTLCDNDYANPVFIFDEIEKAGSSEKGDPHDAMLMLLEENTAKTFRDEFMQVPIDASHGSFLATANSIESLPPPLLSRFIVVEVSPLSYEDRIKVIASIYRNLRHSEPYGHFFSEAISDCIAEAMARDESLSPRIIRQQLRLAMQRACKPLAKAPSPGSLIVEMLHLHKSAIRTKTRLGFVS